MTSAIAWTAAEITKTPANHSRVRLNSSVKVKAAILKFIRDHDQCTSQDVCNGIDILMTSTKAYLREMHMEGEIVRIPQGHGFTYTLPK